jgi:hypothetical protein
MKLTMVVPDLPIALDQALEGLTRVSAVQLLGALVAGRPMPPIYQHGARYKREPGGREWWQTAADTFDVKEADCEDLATTRAAELRIAPLMFFPATVAELPHNPELVSAIVAGQLYPARAFCKKTGPRMYHALVRHPDGREEDPSRALGMPVPRRRRP